jgi:hypothetical protein
MGMNDDCLHPSLLNRRQLLFSGKMVALRSKPSWNGSGGFNFRWIKADQVLDKKLDFRSIALADRPCAMVEHQGELIVLLVVGDVAHDVTRANAGPLLGLGMARRLGDCGRGVKT